MNINNKNVNSFAADNAVRNSARSQLGDASASRRIFYTVVVLYVMAAGVAVLVEGLVSNEFIHCTSHQDEDSSSTTTESFPNPSFRADACRHIRVPFFLFMTREECAFGRSLLASVLLGGMVGFERRLADRPAGIRTMALVSLGSCLFSINSAYGFLLGPMAWDASRVAAAIPSGVGFLGAGLIFKQADKDQITGDTTHVVHGLTTSASLWISAAVGVACAGELYFSASFCVALLVTLLRFGPRHREQCTEDGDGEDPSVDYSAAGRFEVRGLARDDSLDGETMQNPELRKLLSRRDSVTTKSFRLRAALSDDM